MESGSSRREAAEEFDVSPSSAIKWVATTRTTGSWAAKPRGGSASPLEKHANFLLTLIERQSDLTLDEVVCVLRKQGFRSSRTSVWRFFKRHNITFKKNPARGGAATRRRGTGTSALDASTGMFDPAPLVFLDETAANTKMMRVGGRCLRGERLIGQVPHGHWKTITFVGALRCEGMTAPYVIDGAMKGKTLLDSVEHHLAPTLRRNDTVVMDNLPAHKAAGVREAIEARGAVLRYLPQYSPDLNPIEMPFSKLKAYLRKMAERTIPRLRRRDQSVRVISLLVRPRIILGTQAMREIERNLL